MTSGFSDSNAIIMYMHPNVHSSTIYNSQDIETTHVSINRWMDKDAV